MMGFTCIEISYALHISHGSLTGLLPTLQDWNPQSSAPGVCIGTPLFLCKAHLQALQCVLLWATENSDCSRVFQISLG